MLERKTIALPLHKHETLGRSRRALWHLEKSFRFQANAPEEVRQDDDEESEKIHEDQDFRDGPPNLEILRDDEDFVVIASIVKAAQRFHGAHMVEDLDTLGRLQWARRVAREVVLTYYESRQREADQEALLDFLESLGVEFIDLTTMTKLEVIRLFVREKAFHGSGKNDASRDLGDDIPIDPRL